MGFRGGGTAGGGKSNRNAPQYVRHVPRFLQKYEHLMRGGGRGSDEYVQTEDGSSVRASELLAKRQSFEEKEDLADEIEGATVVHELKEIVSQISKKHDPCGESIALTEAEAEREAAEEKDKGNAAYSEGKFQEAIDAFTRAIVLAKKDHHILFSNRSAAFGAAGNWENALIDAKKAVDLRPRWGKAYSRLGAALHGLKRYEEAEAAYAKGLKEEPKNAVLLEGLEHSRRSKEKCDARDEENGKHVFRKRFKPNGDSFPVKNRKLENRGSSQSKVNSRVEEKAKTKTNLLSFDTEDE